MRIDITTLEPKPINSSSKDGLINGLSDRKVKHNYGKDYRKESETTTQSLFPIHDTIQGDVFHKNYMGMLEAAWGSHRGVILTPDVIWFTLLCEVAGIIKDDPEFHRSLFTTSQDKKEIVVYSDKILNLDLVMDELRKLVPSNVDMFLPKFSTSSPESIGACMAAFADAMSPYYNYGMKLCGIPFVDLRGTAEDWLSVAEHWTAMTAALKPTHFKYFGTVHTILQRIVGQVSNPTPAFWKEMFQLERCGSGHDEIVKGWFGDLFRVQPEYKDTKVENYASHVAKVEAVQQETKIRYYMMQGVLSSRDENRALVPCFGRVVYEQREPEVSVKDAEQLDKEFPKIMPSVVIAADEPKNLRLGWIVTEKIGDVIITKSGAEALKRINIE